MKARLGKGASWGAIGPLWAWKSALRQSGILGGAVKYVEPVPACGSEIQHCLRSSDRI
jgi:hypothetical protein